MCFIGANSFLVATFILSVLCLTNQQAVQPTKCSTLYLPYGGMFNKVTTFDVFDNPRHRIYTDFVQSRLAKKLSVEIP